MKLETLKQKIMETFLAWARLKLPEEVFQNLVNDDPNLLELVFTELQSDDTDNLEAASSIIIEFLHLSRSKDKYSSI
jgi:hypothetical protein